jgi:hypothetical protein
MVYFQNQKSQFGQILEGLAMEDVGKFHGRLVYFKPIWYILWPFCKFYGNLVYFFPFWYVVLRKIWQPRCRTTFVSEKLSRHRLLLFQSLFVFSSTWRYFCGLTNFSRKIAIWQHSSPRALKMGFEQGCWQL